MTLLTLAALPSTHIPAPARHMARLSLFDWMVCGLAGTGEPLSQILRHYTADEGGHPIASVFGGGKLPARAAALVNGATSHALDYDDTHFAHIGHLSVAIYPAALAVGEETNASVAAVTDAFVIGAEAAIRLGLTLGAGHYNRGFHQTATAGAFGATVAAGRLYNLTPDQMRHALGLCSTRASGLKSQFGTMGKPYNAGIAAQNGVECAALARAGMTSAQDGIFGPQGFVATHADAPNLTGIWDDLPGNFLFQNNLYKLHACCHGTHAMIEALATALQTLPAQRITALHLQTSPRWLSVCDIKSPRTGLEVKFSYATLAAMTLSGIPTAAEGSYTDAMTHDPALTHLAARVTVTGDANLTEMQAVLHLTLDDGTVQTFTHDLAQRLAPATLTHSLRAKAAGLLGAKADTLWHSIDQLNTITARDLGQVLRAS